MTQGPLRRTVAVRGVTARLGTKPPLPGGAEGRLIFEGEDGRRDSVAIGEEYTGKAVAFEATIQTAPVPLKRDHQLRWKVRWVRQGSWLLQYSGVETRDTAGPLRRFVNKRHLDDTYAAQRPVGPWTYGTPTPGQEITQEEFYSKLYERLHRATKRRK